MRRARSGPGASSLRRPSEERSGRPSTTATGRWCASSAAASTCSTSSAACTTWSPQATASSRAPPKLRSMREREAEPRQCPEDGEEECARVRDAQVLVLLARDPGQVPGRRRHRAHELALRGAPHGVLVLAWGREVADDAEEEQRSSPGPAAGEEGAGDLHDGQDGEQGRDHGAHGRKPAPAGGDVAGIQEWTDVPEQIEDPDAEDQHHPTRL